jgi:hypothetical protein
MVSGAPRRLRDEPLKSGHVVVEVPQAPTHDHELSHSSTTTGILARTPGERVAGG